jgi:hypothetical protein
MKQMNLGYVLFLVKVTIFSTRPTLEKICSNLKQKRENGINEFNPEKGRFLHCT